MITGIGETVAGAADNRENIHDVIKDDCGIILDQLTFLPTALEDLGRGGARLSLESFVKLPPVFQLCLPKESTPRFAHLRWQAGEQFGVQFVSSDAFEALHSEASAERSDTPDRVTVARPTTSTTTVDVGDQPDDERLLPIEYDLYFEPASDDSFRGRCVIAFSIRNDSDIPAIHPFFCLPDMGFQAKPAAGWITRNVVSIRRFVRFCSIRELILAPRSRVGCCFVELGVSPKDGGQVRYSRNIEHPLAQLPKIQLSCQVGAGNFPSQRVQVSIPASHIAGVILDHTGAPSGI
jgi:hypothetical protein